MDELMLLKSLALNNNLSKSEMNVVYFCYKKEKTSKEIAAYLGWAAPNIARLLLSMYNKGFLRRNLLAKDKKTYVYITNETNELLNLK